MNDFISLQQAALQKARLKHAPMNSRHEAYAVILEEVDEFWTEVKTGGESTHPVSVASMLKELTHIAAMCQRAAEDLNLIQKVP